MLFEQSLMEEAERHLRRLGSVAIAASNASWKHDEAIRAVRHAHGAARKDALDRLAALIASYGDETPATPAAPSPFRVGTANIARTLAGGTVASLILLGVTFATRPGSTAAASPARPAPIMSPADAAKMEALLAQGVAMLRRLAGDPAACTDSAEVIRPVWRR